MTSIALVTLSPADLRWDRGPIEASEANASSATSALERSARSADVVLLWDPTLGQPPNGALDALLSQPVDAWHAGLLLGQGGRPALLDHVVPRWMLNLDPPSGQTVTSWRLSLRALLVRSAIVRELGGPSTEFDTLSGAGLDLGLRWIMRGAVLRHTPALLHAVKAPAPDPEPSSFDQVRLVARTWGRRWAVWASVRGRRSGAIDCSLSDALGVARRTSEAPAGPLPATARTDEEPAPSIRVSVIVPTVDRYPYLDQLLPQLAAQDTPPHEVVVIDQTPLGERRGDLAARVPGLPLLVLTQDEPGQCRSRNAGLLAATGDAFLFLDDDDEIPPDLISGHLARLVNGIDASCGGIDDATAGPPPEGFRHRRVSDVFPTNNTMVRREALERSGLFDLAYDRGSRADHDLGMRLYLGGALLVYDPSVRAYHHHAPRGGLRTHGARKVTRAQSRRGLLGRDLPGSTEAYLGQRYFTSDQNDEYDLIIALSQLFGDGGRVRRAARFIVQFVLLPGTIRQVRATRREASSLLAQHPIIPPLLPAATRSSVQSVNPQ